jgi:hypothetical protein
MKKLIVLFAVLAVTLPTFAQNDGEPDNGGREMQTLMGKNNVIGGYGAFSFQYTEIDDRDAFVFGARGAMVIGHMMSIGIGGAGFFTDVQNNLGTDQDISLAGGYGGFFFEPIVMPRFPVHISFPILIGAGGVSVVSVDDDNNEWNDNYKSEASDAFMVIEPGVEVELNVTKFFRFCVGASYRYTTDVDITETNYEVSKDILKGFSGGVTFKFGRF